MKLETKPKNLKLGLLTFLDYLKT